jgi:hypothetical protein
MHQQILKLRHAQFGASSERLSTQTDLFAEILDLPLPPVVKQKISYERQRKGRPALPKDLPRQRIEFRGSWQWVTLNPGMANTAALLASLKHHRSSIDTQPDHADIARRLVAPVIRELCERYKIQLT